MIKCHECEDITRLMFFASVMKFIRQVIANLDYLKHDIAQRPVQRSNNVPQAPKEPTEALMYSLLSFGLSLYFICRVC